jgi:hypothetical protein
MYADAQQRAQFDHLEELPTLSGCYSTPRVRSHVPVLSEERCRNNRRSSHGAILSTTRGEFQIEPRFYTLKTDAVHPLTERLFDSALFGIQHRPRYANISRSVKRYAAL